MNFYLPKYLAYCGVCSRRKAAEFVKNGLVYVNGELVDDVTYVVKAEDKVKFDDRIIKPVEFKYILLNKPKDYITTVSDDRGRKTVLDLIKIRNVGRIYPVGRLDRMTTGLIFLTNDGQLAQKLAHPRHEIAKKYYVVLDRPFESSDFEKLSKGVRLRDGFTKVDNLSYGKKDSKKTVVIQLHSGKNRIVRRLFEHFGYKVKKLDRFYYAGLTKDGLDIGKWRLLNKREIEALKNI